VVVLGKPAGHLRGKSSVIGTIPGSRGRSIAHRPVHFTGLEALAQEPGSLNALLGDRNQGNL
jgi:hypothetical protein